MIVDTILGILVIATLVGALTGIWIYCPLWFAIVLTVLIVLLIAFIILLCNTVSEIFTGLYFWK